MKRGHVDGTKKERKHAPDWYREREEANSRRIAAEWQAQPSGKRSRRESKMSREVFAAPRGLQAPNPSRHRDESCRG